MKESKISLLLLLSLSMLIFAFVVLFIWGFSYYKQTVSTDNPSTIIVKDSSSIAGDIRDSLQKFYASTINKLNVQLDSTRLNVDSIQVNMDAKLTEFNNLKNEIAVILQNSQFSSSDIGIARQKILELQKRLDDWQSKYVDVSQENKRLSQLLDQLSKSSVKITEPTATRKTTADNSAPINRAVVPAPSIVVTDISFRAIAALDEKDQETVQAFQTDKLNGSIEFKSNESSVNGMEIYIVILQPDGKVMRQSAWETGMFETKEGRKIYSYKMSFDYIKGEQKRLHFSMPSPQFQQGNYILQVYHNGKIIARASKSLS